jgi:hypothetical protein
MRELKQSTVSNVMVFMTDSADHITGIGGVVLTVTASKNGGAFGGIAPAQTDRGSGWYNLVLTAPHTDTLGELCLHITAAGADPSDIKTIVVANLSSDVATLIGTPVALDGAAATVGGMLTKIADDNGGADFDATTDSLTSIRDSIQTAAPSNEVATGGTITEGTQVDNTFAATQLSNDTRWGVDADAPAPEGLDVVLTFATGDADLIPVEVFIEGYLSGAHPINEWVDFYVYNFTNLVWDKLSGNNASTRMHLAASDQEYTFSLNSNHIDTVVPGQVQIRFLGENLSGNEKINLDYVTVRMTTSSALTAPEIAEAVWNHNVEQHTSLPTAGAYLVDGTGLATGTILSVTDASNFVIDNPPGASGVWDNHIIVVHTESTGDVSCVPIATCDTSGNTVTREPLYAVPVVGDHYIVMHETAVASIFEEGLEDIETGVVNGLTTFDAATVDDVKVYETENT